MAWGSVCLVLVATLLPVVVTGCGGSDPPSSPPSRTTQISVGRSPDEPLVVELPGPPASEYRTDRTVDPDSPLARNVAARLPGVALDPCLQRAAAAHGRVPPELLDHLPLAFTEDALHWAGCPDATATLAILLTTETGLDPLLDHLAPRVEESGCTHLGFSRSDAPPPYRTRWLALLVRRRFSLRPLPTSADPGTVLPLQFHLDRDFARATIAVTLPRGEVRTVDVGFSAGWAVCPLPLAGEEGRQWVEIIGDGAAGPQVLALFPVAVGREPARRFVGEMRPDESWVRSTEQAEELLADLIRRDRRRFDLKELERDPELDAIARGYSREMAESRFFAHVSPVSGSVVDRLRARAYPASFAAENIARAGSLTEAEEGLMRSPGHRAAILSRRATRFGVGVATTDGDGMGPLFLVTQVFVATHGDRPGRQLRDQVSGTISPDSY